MKKNKFINFFIAYVGVYFAVFMYVGISTLLSDKSSGFESALFLPIVLTVMPFMVLNHYPETLVLMFFYILVVFFIAQKWKILENISVLMFLVFLWQSLGFFCFIRKAIDY